MMNRGAEATIILFLNSWLLSVALHDSFTQHKLAKNTGSTSELKLGQGKLLLFKRFSLKAAHHPNTIM